MEMESDFLIVMMIVWGAIGLFVTPFVFKNKGRDPQRGAILGLIAGAAGGIILLGPLWFFLPLRGKKCPECAETIRREALTCQYCSHQFPPESLAETPPPTPLHRLILFADWRPALIFTALGITGVAALIVTVIDDWSLFGGEVFIWIAFALSGTVYTHLKQKADWTGALVAVGVGVVSSFVFIQLETVYGPIFFCRYLDYDEVHSSCVEDIEAYEDELFGYDYQDDFQWEDFGASLMFGITAFTGWMYYALFLGIMKGTHRNRMVAFLIITTVVLLMWGWRSRFEQLHGLARYTYWWEPQIWWDAWPWIGLSLLCLVPTFLVPKQRWHLIVIGGGCAVLGMITGFIIWATSTYYYPTSFLRLIIFGGLVGVLGWGWAIMLRWASELLPFAEAPQAALDLPGLDMMADRTAKAAAQAQARLGQASRAAAAAASSAAAAAAQAAQDRAQARAAHTPPSANREVNPETYAAPPTAPSPAVSQASPEAYTLPPTTPTPVPSSQIDPDADTLLPSGPLPGAALPVQAVPSPVPAIQPATLTPQQAAHSIIAARRLTATQTTLAGVRPLPDSASEHVLIFTFATPDHPVCCGFAHLDQVSQNTYEVLGGGVIYLPGPNASVLAGITILRRRAGEPLTVTLGFAFDPAIDRIYVKYADDTKRITQVTSGAFVIMQPGIHSIIHLAALDAGRNVLVRSIPLSPVM